MLQHLIDHRLVTPPAIWGKLPRHADFVRSHMRHGESEGWQTWLVQQGCLDGAAGAVGPVALPTAFVLPPCSLSFARHRFVLGVLAPSFDKVGRPHVLLVYQLAHLRWLRPQFDEAALVPQDWLFWLARTVARHGCASGETDATGATGTGGGSEPSDMQTLVRAVQRMWRVYAPGARQLWGRCDVSVAARRQRQAQAWRLLDELGSPSSVDDRAAQLRGVSCLPWADWPQRLYRPRGNGNFWQQDAYGGFVNAATRLPVLWGDA